MDWMQAQKECICGMCPSYFDCGEKLAFCMSEASISQCIKRENGCICPGCPVQGQMNFQHNYYCIKGNENLLISR
jgi:hypothetical protein